MIMRGSVDGIVPARELALPGEDAATLATP